jgi:hypothetical protein
MKGKNTHGIQTERWNRSMHACAETQIPYNNNRKDTRCTFTIL